MGGNANRGVAKIPQLWMALGLSAERLGTEYFKNTPLFPSVPRTNMLEELRFR